MPDVTVKSSRVPDQNVELARYRPLAAWKPTIGDFVIWHGWFLNRWYGVINSILDNEVTVITEGLPCLLFTLPESEREKHLVHIPLYKIKSSRGGEYHIEQNGVWYF
jgi:hypothetical protein